MGFETFGNARFRYWVATLFCFYAAIVLSGFVKANLFMTTTVIFAGITIGLVLAVIGVAVGYWIYKNSV